MRRIRRSAARRGACSISPPMPASKLQSPSTPLLYTLSVHTQPVHTQPAAAATCYRERRENKRGIELTTPVLLPSFLLPPSSSLWCFPRYHDLAAKRPDDVSRLVKLLAKYQATAVDAVKPEGCQPVAVPNTQWGDPTAKGKSWQPCDGPNSPHSEL